MPPENLVSLQVSLISLAFRCYPEQINLVDKVLESALLALDKIAMEKYVLFIIHDQALMIANIISFKIISSS